MYSLQKSINNIYACTLPSHISSLFDFIFLQDFSDVDRKGIPMPITTADARPSRAPRKTHRLTPRLGVVLLPLFLAACGLPPAVTVASFAIDAISLAVSDKTVADHALSQIVQQDCSIWRGFTGDICIDEDSTIAVAAADGQPPAGGADSADLGAVATASGPISEAAASAQSARDRQLVAGTQSGLKRMGYDPGPIDGILGPRTQAAIRAYQRDHGLAIDERPTQALALHIQAQLGDQVGGGERGTPRGGRDAGR